MFTSYFNYEMRSTTVVHYFESHSDSSKKYHLTCHQRWMCCCQMPSQTSWLRTLIATYFFLLYFQSFCVAPVYLMLFNGFSLRTFELQFLLLTRSPFHTHVIAGLNVFDRWVLYDDLKLPYGDFNPKCADFKGDFSILFAGYVNITQDQDRDGMFIYYFTLCVQKVLL